MLQDSIKYWQWKMFISIALITCKTSKKKHKLEVRKGILDGWMISESADAEMRRAQWVLPACKHLVLSTYHIWPNFHTLSSKQGYFPCLTEDTPNIDLTMYILRIQSKTWIWAQVSRNNTAKSHLSINLLKKSDAKNKRRKVFTSEWWGRGDDAEP